jgi:putative oxidoreductase
MIINRNYQQEEHNMNSFQAVVSVVGRVLLSHIFIISGISKATDPQGTIGYIQSVGAPLPEVAYAIALIVELGLATALLVGFKARWAAAGIALFTIATAFLFHFNLADQMQQIMFLKNLTITGGLLLVVAFGPGAYSLDNRRR